MLFFWWLALCPQLVAACGQAQPCHVPGPRSTKEQSTCGQSLRRLPVAVDPTEGSPDDQMIVVAPTGSPQAAFREAMAILLNHLFPERPRYAHIKPLHKVLDAKYYSTFITAVQKACFNVLQCCISSIIVHLN